MRPDDPRPASRRALLGTAAASLSGALAGCSHWNLPFVDVPSLTDAWLSVRENGDAAFVLRFDGDIRTAIERSGIERSDLVSAAAEHDVELEFGDVDLRDVDPRRGEDGDEIPEDRLVRGRFRAVVETADAPVGRWYSTPLVTYERDVPDDAAVPLTLQFPNGYRYVLPEAHRRARRYPVFEFAREYEAVDIFDYRGAPPERTFPHLRHYSHPDLVEMRAGAEYRYRVLREAMHLFDPDWYLEQSFEAVRAGAAEIAGEIAKEAIGAFLTHPLPDWISAALDLKSTHDALRTEFTEFQSALETLERGLEASVNVPWLRDLVPDDDTPGLPRLSALSQTEWEYHNPALVSVPPDDFEAQIARYERLLSEQRLVTRRLRSPDSTFQTYPVYGQGYWQDVHALAAGLVAEFDEFLAESQAVLERLKRDLERR